MLMDAQRRVSENIERSLSFEALKRREYVGRIEGQSHKQYSGMSLFNCSPGVQAVSFGVTVPFIRHRWTATLDC